MRTRRAFHSGVATAALMVLVNTSPVPLSAQPTADPAMRVSENELGGVVAGPNGPEAGVWVIAETTELPTKFAKIVVTDERGRYLIPELPKAKYSVWVRGFGLVNSPKVEAAPGRILDLAAAAAPNEKAAAQYYPAMYWYSLLNVPQKSEFPMPKIKSQGEWLNIIKTGACNSCHALGTPGMRTILPELGEFKTSVEAWKRRLMSGQRADRSWSATSRGSTPTRALAMFADWTDRIAAGELPFAKPARPQGVERNVVVTLWDWASPPAYLARRGRDRPAQSARQRQWQDLRLARGQHGLSAGPRSGTHTASEMKHPVRDPNTPSSKGTRWRRRPTGAPSRSGTARPSTTTRCSTRRACLVHARVSARPPTRTTASKARMHPSAKLFPIDSERPQFVDVRSGDRQIHADPTCFPTHHLNFASDADRRCGPAPASARACSAGSTAKCTRRPATRRSRKAGLRSCSTPTATAGAMLCRARPAARPGEGQAGRSEHLQRRRQPGRRLGLGNGAGLSRRSFGSSPEPIRPIPRSRNSTSPPAPRASVRAAPTSIATAFSGCRSRADISASFDRRKCKVLNGPTATGKHCPGSWTLHPASRPAISRRDRRRQRGSELLRLGRPVRHVRARPQRADRHGQPQRLLWRWSTGKLFNLRVPTRSACSPRSRRAHRRSERRLEGQGPVDDDRHAHALPQ